MTPMLLAMSLSGDPIISIAISLLVLAVICYIIFGLIKPPHPIDKIIMVILCLVLVVWLLRML